jgi:uncharacterized secreted repeat protein (TIGR03808 family)
MHLPRRTFLSLLAAAAAAPVVSRAEAKPLAGSQGLDVAQFGVRPGSPDDQTRVLQNAIDKAAATRTPLFLAPGVYRCGQLRLQSGTQLLGVRGATKLVQADALGLISATQADAITLSGLTFDGGNRPLPQRRGLVHIESGRALRIVDCEIVGAGGLGLALQAVEGEVTGCTILRAAESGIFSFDARGLSIVRNVLRACGNNGIQVWRSDEGDDGTIVSGNRIEDTRANSGGSGQNGNAINVFRAANVVVSGNRIVRPAFSAVRGNAASNLHVTGNSCSDCGEVAIYAEFGFQGALIAHNTIDGAAIGVSVTNFNNGGRLAVVQGNIIRRLATKRPVGTDPNDGAGVGIAVEADSAVTGNVVEDAPTMGIALGWGRHLRDVTATGNVIRKAGIGIGVSVSGGAGSAVIADNLIAETPGGAVVGMDLKRPVTGDLVRDGVGRYAQLALSGNRVR